MCTTFWLSATPSPALKGNFISICKCIALMIGMDKKTVLIRRRYCSNVRLRYKFVDIMCTFVYVYVRLRCTFDG